MIRAPTAKQKASAMSRKRILFVAEAATLAHVARPLLLAQALDPERYEVHFACDPRFDKLLPTLPFTRHTLRSVPSSRLLDALARGKPLYDTETLRDYVTQDLALIERTAPDLVVGDLRLSLAVSAPLSRVRYLTISNAYWSPYAQQRYPVPELPLTKALGVDAAQRLFDLTRPAAFALHTVPLNRVRRQYGLRHLGWDLRRIYTWADHCVYADIPELVPTYRLPDNHHYIGPLIWSPEVPTPAWWNDLPADRPIVYVTLGSSGRSELLPAILDTLSAMPLTVIAATAGRSEVNRAMDRIFVADYLPGSEAASRSRLVICNGGSPTTQQALAYGVPVLGIPSNLDQHLNMEAIQRSGAGLTVRSEKANAQAIGNAVTRLLADATHARAAEDVARLFRQYDAPARFSSLVAQIT